MRALTKGLVRLVQILGESKLKVECFRHIVFFATILALMLTSCKESSTDVHSVEPEFEEYIQRFFAYAEQYGTPIADKNIIMKFKSGMGSTAGLCHMNYIPITIDINEGYWITFAGSTIETEIKEDLIFHEMAHGFLRRDHDNTVLKNGDWKTMMLGDALPNGRSSNINYRGMRKEYYIKELFTQTTEVPSWSTYVPDFSKVVESEYYHATPANEKNWLKGTTDKYSAYIENSTYIYKNTTDNSSYVPLLNSTEGTSILDVTGDFYFEAEAKISSTSVVDHSGGIGFANYTNPDAIIEPLHYMNASSKKLIGIGENSCVALFVQLYTELYTPDEFNKLAIRKKGDTLFYYINNTFLYHNDLTKIPVKGSSFGFTVGGHCQLTVKDVVIKTAGTPKSAPETDYVKPQPIDLGKNFAIVRESY